MFWEAGEYGRGQHGLVLRAVTRRHENGKIDAGIVFAASDINTASRAHHQTEAAGIVPAGFEAAVADYREREVLAALAELTDAEISRYAEGSDRREEGQESQDKGAEP